MKIDDRVSNYMSLLLADSTPPSSKAKEKAGQQAVPSSKADNVTISPTATQLVDDEAHHARLLAIRQQLSEGSYNISGKDVAEKMIKLLKS